MSTRSVVNCDSVQTPATFIKVDPRGFVVPIVHCLSPPPQPPAHPPPHHHLNCTFIPYHVGLRTLQKEKERKKEPRTLQDDERSSLRAVNCLAFPTLANQTDFFCPLTGRFRHERGRGLPFILFTITLCPLSLTPLQLHPSNPLYISPSEPMTTCASLHPSFWHLLPLRPLLRKARTLPVSG
jgi:hypothetical protein